MSSKVLLKGGVILEHGSGDKVTWRNADVLIDGNRIARVATDILPTSAEPAPRIIDCTDTIISPGFIDSHRHTWQTQLKGRHADQLYLQYLPTGQKAFVYYDEHDSRVAELAGALESIAAGTTTIFDFNHNMASRQAIEAAAEGLIDSGVRAVYCIGPRMIPKRDSYDTETIEPMVPEWFFEMYLNLANNVVPTRSDGRVHLAFNLDYVRFPQHEDNVVSLYKQVVDAGGPGVACFHDFGPSLPSTALWKRGLDMKQMISAHSNNQKPEYYEKLVQEGVHFATTPSTELQMGFGRPICFEPDLKHSCGLGVDCHSVTAGSVVSEARIGLQAYRAAKHQEVLAAGGFPSQIHATIEDAFNLLTVGGAQTIKMPGQVGSLKEGMFADLLVWDATSPAMIAAAQQNPVAAVVLHSSPADLKHVMIDGHFRKYDGKLLPAKNRDSTMEWSEIAKELLESRKKVQARIDAADVAAGRRSA